MLVCLCTIAGAAAQMLMKSGTLAAEVPNDPLRLFIFALTNPKLFAGYVLYGISTVLLTLALKYGELSLIYPVIALTYVWVTVLSVTMFGESINPWKIAGLTTVVTGVAILGRASRK